MQWVVIHWALDLMGLALFLFSGVEFLRFMRVSPTLGLMLVGIVNIVVAARIESGTSSLVIATITLTASGFVIGLLIARDIRDAIKERTRGIALVASVEPKPLSTLRNFTSVVYAKANERYWRDMLDALYDEARRQGIDFVRDENPPNRARQPEDVPDSRWAMIERAVVEARKRHLFPLASDAEIVTDVECGIVNGYGQALVRDILFALRSVGVNPIQVRVAEPMMTPVAVDDTDNIVGGSGSFYKISHEAGTLESAVAIAMRDAELDGSTIAVHADLLDCDEKEAS